MAVIPENPPLGDCKKFPLSAPTPLFFLNLTQKQRVFAKHLRKKSRFSKLYFSSFAFLKVTTNAPFICADVAI